MNSGKEGDFILKNTKTLIEEPKKIDISVGGKYGCLQVLDDGAEYLRHINTKIMNIKKEKADFVKAIEENRITINKNLLKGNRNDWIPAYNYKPTSFKVYNNFVRVCDFDEEISKLIIAKEIKHYKCICKKCGKTRYYSNETLQTQPKFCYKPIYYSSKYTYSTKAQNATYRQKKKYKNNESVFLIDNKDALNPSIEYCDLWNKEREKKLIKRKEKDAKIIAAIPRKYAKNYDKNFVGLKYESYEVLECVNEALESAPTPYYDQKKCKDIIVYKEYRCKCYLCGKEKLVKCDEFGIYPPTQYGYRAYNGYWSEVYCDCHPISSFQWIVNDILIKHNIEYKVEVSVDGVYGIDNETPLRFDFAIYKGKKIFAFLECQGEQHYKPVEEFGGECRFAIQQKNDEKKREYAKEKNIKLIEISYKYKKYEIVESILKNNNII